MYREDIGYVGEEKLRINLLPDVCVIVTQTQPLGPVVASSSPTRQSGGNGKNFNFNLKLRNIRFVWLIKNLKLN